MQPLRQTLTGNDYTNPCTLLDISAERIKYKVANASVFVQLMPRNPHGGESEWGPEFLVTPEDGSYSDTIGIRFRSAIAGQPAQVLAQAFSPGDPVAEGAVPVLGTLLSSGAFVSQGITLLQAQQSAQLAISQAFQVQTGLSVTFNVSGANATAMAWFFSDLQVAVTGTGLLSSALFLDIVQVSNPGNLNDPGAANRGTVGQGWEGAISPGAHTFDVRAQKGNAGGTGFANTFSVLLVIVRDA